MMTETGAPFSFHPYGYENKPTKKRAVEAIQPSDDDNTLLAKLAEHLIQPADTATRDLGRFATLSTSFGLLEATYDRRESTSLPSTRQAAMLGSVSLYDYMRAEAGVAPTDAAVLGYAEQRRD